MLARPSNKVRKKTKNEKRFMAEWSRERERERERERKRDNQ